MTTILVDPSAGEGELRRILYQGNLVLFTDVAAVTELVEFARSQLREIFRPYEPEEAHEHFSPEEAAVILAKWKPAFMREQQSKRLLRAIVEEVGFLAGEIHADLLKPRTAFPVGHLTTGIAFAFPWHRDTWYAAPAQQINWWFPIFEVRSNNAMKFDLPHFARPVANSSAGFDYYEINRQRSTTGSQIKVEAQARPAAIDHNPPDCTIVLPQPGSILLFSGTHLHASIANESGRSRYSIDFRTVDRRDVEQGIGAPVVDAECSGTALRDFVNMVSAEPFDEALVQRIHGAPPPDALLVYAPGPTASR